MTTPTNEPDHDRALPFSLWALQFGDEAHTYLALQQQTMRAVDDAEGGYGCSPEPGSEKATSLEVALAKMRVMRRVDEAGRGGSVRLSVRDLRLLYGDLHR